MNNFYGVMDSDDKDQIWTYECSSAAEAARLYLEDVELAGVVVRVWMLGRHPSAFMKTKNGAVLAVDSPEKVEK